MYLQLQHSLVLNCSKRHISQRRHFSTSLSCFYKPGITIVFGFSMERITSDLALINILHLTCSKAEFPL